MSPLKENNMDKKLDPKWVEIMINAYIGPNLQQYALTDPEGIQRSKMIRNTLTTKLTEAYDRIMKEDGLVKVESFTRTAQQIILQGFTSFIRLRAETLLADGLPKIIKPN